MSLQRKVAITFSGTLLSFAVLAAAILSWESSRRVEAHIINQGVLLTQGLAANSAEALLKNDVPLAESTLARMFFSPDIEGAAIFRPDLSVMAREGKSSQAILPEIAHPTIASNDVAVKEGEATWAITVAVRAEEKTSLPALMLNARQLGLVRVIVNKHSFRKLQRSIWISNAVGSFAIYGLLMAFSYMCVKRFFHPLAELANELNRARKNSTVPRILDVNRSAEIVEISHGINHLKGEIDEREAQIRSYRDQVVQASAQKKQFASLISYEVRTSLNNVLGTLELLGVTPLTRRQGEFVDIAFKSSLALTKAVDGIINVTRDEKAVMEQVETPAPISNMGLSNGHSVLVVDDNKTSRIVMGYMLEALGCQCELIADGVAAVNALTTKSFDVVFMDCSMPSMDGYEATSRIRQYESSIGRHTPIIGLSASANEDSIKRCYSAGMDDFLAKPAKVDDIKLKITTWTTNAPTSMK